EKSESDEKIYLKTVTCWYPSAVKDIITHPVYCGKIRWGNSRTVVENGITKRVCKDDAIIVDGNHEPIISEELFEKAQQCFENRTEKFRNRKPANQSPRNILNQIARCPQCGSGMVACAAQYKTVKGEVRYYYSYICGYYNNHKGGECRKNAIKADLLEGAVLETIKKYLQRPNVVQEITDCLTTQFDTTKLKLEIERLESQINAIKENENRQYNIMSQIGLEGKYQDWDFEKVEKNLETLIANRKSIEVQMQEKMAALEAAEAEQLDADDIKHVLEHFEEAFQCSSKENQKLLLQSILQEVQLEKKKIDGKEKVLPKSLTLKVTGEQINVVKENLGLKEANAETVAILSKVK
ncbi:MAG: recombinase family protein, partial [Lachnospiraceae bacterium]|nr:recombinase family protein [Lachnospiraceae bacterium]